VPGSKLTCAPSSRFRLTAPASSPPSPRRIRTPSIKSGCCQRRSWSPNGRQIVYQKDVNGQKQLFLVNADGTGGKQLTSGANLHVDATWSLDGNFIFYRSPEGGAWAIWRMNADGSNRVKLIDGVPPVDWAFEKLAVSR
jgi:hypothetical protein